MNPRPYFGSSVSHETPFSVTLSKTGLSHIIARKEDQTSAGWITSLMVNLDPIHKGHPCLLPLPMVAFQGEG